MTDQALQHLFTEATAALRRDDPAAARQHLEAVLDAVPEQPQALNSLGMLALNENDFAHAAELFDRAAKADPTAAPLWLNCAKAQRAMGDDEAERASLDHILQIDQRHFMANLRKAELHERLGETAQATRSWQTVLLLASMQGELPEALQERLAHAQSFVGERNADFEAAIDRGLADARAGLDGAELRRFDAALGAMLGKRKIYHNQCEGLYFPFLPADEFFPRAHFPWMKQFEAATGVIKAELEALLRDGEAGFTPYVKMPSGTPATIWSELDHSPRWSAFYLWEFGDRYDEACARCPATAAAVAAIPQADIPRRAPTAFFSLLSPRTHIPAHTGVSNIRATVHLPLIVPPGCGFRVGGETREWKPGEAFAFDDTIEHEAWNDSDELRAILIVDIWNPHLSEAEQTLLRTFYSTAEASGHNPEPQ